MCVCVWGGGRGLQPPHPKKPALSFFFSFGVQSFIIYTYEYIDNTADKGVCKSIHFHYIDSYYGRRDTDFLFVACPGREACWSWSPTLLQLCSGQSPLRNLWGFVPAGPGPRRRPPAGLLSVSAWSSQMCSHTGGSES